jgi:hypothetical protein
MIADPITIKDIQNKTGTTIEVAHCSENDSRHSHLINVNGSEDAIRAACVMLSEAFDNLLDV